jgi:hypothetical protein
LRFESDRKVTETRSRAGRTEKVVGIIRSRKAQLRVRSNRDTRHQLVALSLLCQFSSKVAQMPGIRGLLDDFAGQPGVLALALGGQADLFFEPYL